MARLAHEACMANGQDAEPVYDEANIKILTTSTQAIRARPGPYIGDTTPIGLHHLVFELVDNSIQEALAGHGTEVRVMLHADGSASVADDGRGISVEPRQQFAGKSKLEVVLTTLHV
jgi:DNA gyrase subunit B